MCVQRIGSDGLGLCRRTAHLREKFCFTCCCERCAAERSPPPSAQNAANDNDTPSPPAWFLSAMAPPGLPEEAALEDAGRSMSQIRNLLAELMEQAQELFVECGRAAEAWAVLEAGIYKARNLHAPLHSHCRRDTGLICTLASLPCRQEGIVVAHYVPQSLEFAPLPLLDWHM